MTKKPTFSAACEAVPYKDLANATAAFQPVLRKSVEI
jgi:hypothetical protein